MIHHIFIYSFGTDIIWIQFYHRLDGAVDRVMEWYEIYGRVFEKYNPKLINHLITQIY